MIAPFATILQTLVHRPGLCNPFFSLQLGVLYNLGVKIALNCHFCMFFA